MCCVNTLDGNAVGRCQFGAQYVMKESATRSGFNLDSVNTNGGSHASAWEMFAPGIIHVSPKVRLPTMTLMVNKSRYTTSETFASQYLFSDFSKEANLSL